MDENSQVFNYGLAFLVKEEDGSKVKQALEKNGVTVNEEKPLQKIKLAYPIKNNQYGFIGFMNFEAAPGILNVLESALNLEKELLRYTLTRVIIKANKPASEPRNDFRMSLDNKRKAFSAKEPVRPAETTLTNEALEKKIEEILK